MPLIMSSKRLLDALEVLKASKSVATKHLAIRQRQLDVYTRTSSLTKGVKGQVDGLILTAQAAAVLAKKVNDESGPSADVKSNDNSKSVAFQNVDSKTPSPVAAIRDAAPKDVSTARPEKAPAKDQEVDTSVEQIAPIPDLNPPSRTDEFKREQQSIVGKTETGKEGERVSPQVGR